MVVLTDPLTRVRDRVLRLGARPTDAPDERLRQGRMESHGVCGRIQVSEAVAGALADDYRFEERGTIAVNGIGEMKTFFLLGRA